MVQSHILFDFPIFWHSFDFMKVVLEMCCAHKIDYQSFYYLILGRAWESLKKYLFFIISIII